MNETLQYWIGISEHSCGSSMPIGACLACDMVTIQKELTTVTEQRDGLRSGIDYASDQLHKVTEQRDRLADALRKIAMQNLSEELDDHTCEHADWQYGYEEIIRISRQALQSLTTNEQ
jgi:hypothetical protein